MSPIKSTPLQGRSEPAARDPLSAEAAGDAAAGPALARLAELVASALDVDAVCLALREEGTLIPAAWGGSASEATLVSFAPAALAAGGAALKAGAMRAEVRVVEPDAAPAGVLALPLPTGPEGPEGVVCAISAPPRDWTERERALLDGAAAAMAAHLELPRARAARGHLQTALQRSEQLYRQLVESASDIIYRADLGGCFTYANPAAERVTGYPARELIGRHFTDVVRPDFCESVARQYARQLAEELPTTYLELPILTRDGRELWIGQNVQLLRASGRVVGVQAVARDITGRLAVERALRESEERFRNVVESLGQGLLITDDDDVVVYANPQLASITGYAPDEWLGRAAGGLLLPRAASVAGDLGAIARLEHGLLEVEHVRKDGTRVWLEIHAVPYRSPEGRAVGTLALVQDVGERKRAEEALRESEERFRLMVEGSEQVFFYVHGTDYRFQYLSPSVREVLGYEPEELTGVSFEYLLTGDPSDAQVLASTDQGLSSGSGLSTYTVVTRHRDGHRVPVEVVETPVVHDGAVVGMQGFARDITERQRAKEALERSEEYFRSITENALDVIHVVNADGTTRYLSPSVTRLLGYDPAELLGRSAEDLVHPDDLPGLLRVLRRARRSGNAGSTVFRVRHRDGSWRIFEAVMRNLLNNAAVAGMVINSRDITERRRAEEENQRLAALSRENPNPVLACDAEGRPVHVNPAAERISQELGLADVTALLPESHEQLVRSSLQAGQGFQSVEAVVEDRTYSWTYRPFPDAGTVYLFAIDITGRRLMEEQLRHDALHDALTGLPNRLLFMERMAHAILRAKRRENYLFAVLFLDLDRFKVINDSLGHHVGDELLMVVAKRLQACLRTEDTVARLGGDEFAILLEGIVDIRDATRVAERIQAELSAPVNLSGFEVFTAASIGIVLSSTAYDRPEYLLRNADMAMYRAKSVGRSRFEVFDRAMHAEALARLQMETDLRRALERDELRVHYQPVVDLATGRIRSVEALVRWAHPGRGWMAPDAFIPVAEETGLILSIGGWVLREACRQVRAWRDELPSGEALSVGVNLSAKQLSQGDLVEQISAALEENGLPPSALWLEITESAFMENAEAAAGLLGRLRALGVRISLDDFGTGYSSLSYLHRFPLDSLKIDRSFIGRMDQEDRPAQLVRAILTLAGSLGVSVVAEGIETPQQLDALRQMQCGFGQGYLFARPLPPAEVAALLRSNAVW